MKLLDEVIQRVEERFDIRDALAFADKIDDATRKRLGLLLRTAWEKRDAAEALATAGSYVDAIRLMNEASSTVRRVEELLKEDGWIPTRRAERLFLETAELRKELGDPPELNSQVSGAKRDLISREVLVLHRVQGVTDLTTLAPASLRRLRVRRWVEAAALLAGVVAACSVVNQALYGVRVRASSELAPSWTADRAIDGDPSTDWVSGTGDAWIELQFPRRRRVRSLHLFNGQFFPERATRDIRVEVFNGDDIANVVTASFNRSAEPLTLDLGGFATDRVRITTLSHIGTSAAIAEIRWE